MLVSTYPMRPNEAMTREEAVVAHTATSAYAEFDESRKGTLESGKLADIARRSILPRAISRSAGYWLLITTGRYTLQITGTAKSLWCTLQAFFARNSSTLDSMSFKRSDATASSKRTPGWQIADLSRNSRLCYVKGIRQRSRADSVLTLSTRQNRLILEDVTQPQ